MGGIQLKKNLMAIQKTADYWLNKSKNLQKKEFYQKVFNKAVFKLKHFFNFECYNYNNIYWIDIKLVNHKRLKSFLYS